MHADPSDRIVSVAGPEVSPVSVPRIFVVGLVLPFAHPIRLVLGSVLPLVVIAAAAFGPIGRVFTAWKALASGPIAIGQSTTAPPVLPTGYAIDVLEAEGVLFLAMALWLCAWQRAAARGFGEPILHWLGGSLGRFPGYILALLLWVLAPAMALFVPVAALGALVARRLGTPSPDTTPQGAFARLAAIGGMFSTLQWWVIGIAFVVIILLALWLNARLAPLPPLVASQGWRRAFGRAWQLSRGHGFGLAVSLVGYSLLAFLLLMIGAMASGAVMYTRSPLSDPGSIATFVAVGEFAIWALVALWHASLGALVVRDGLSAAEAIDPAMFD
jgi:hypothetical protein